MPSVLRKTAARVGVTLINPTTGQIADADSPPTVVITRDSDGVQVFSGTATDDTSALGAYYVTLTPANLPDVDLLRGTWTATVGGVGSQVTTTQTDVVGGYLCTLEAISAAMVGETATTTALLIEARDLATQRIEEACDVAFVPRYSRETIYRPISRQVLNHRRVTAILAYSVDNVTTAFTTLELNRGGVVEGLTGSEVSVAYRHGFDSSPAPVTRACIRLARHYLTTFIRDEDERATSISTDEATYSLVTPGVRGAETSIPEVNAVIERFGHRLGVA